MAERQRRCQRGEAEVGDRDLQRQVGPVRHLALERVVAIGGVEAEAEQLDVLRVLEDDARAVERDRVVELAVGVAAEQKSGERCQTLLRALEGAEVFDREGI